MFHFNHNLSKSLIFVSTLDLSFHDVNTSIVSKFLLFLANITLDVPEKTTDSPVASLKIPICFIRPTLIFGSTDPHNGYGPNSFKRLVLKKKDIQLFGKGEELRDHIFIDDVAKLIVNVFLCRYEGSLNIATGKVISFHEIAKIIKNKYQSKIKIKFSKRKGPMPHNGYRPFNVGTIYKLFPDIKFTNFEKAILK